MTKLSKNSLSFKACAASMLALMALGGCTKEISPDIYSSDNVGEAAYTYKGVIINARVVTMQGHDKLEGNSAGIGLGAIAGGLAGSAFGKGHGQIATTLGGAVLGGVGGAYAQKALSKQKAMEYVIKTDDGDLRTVVQGLEPTLRVGQGVLLMVYVTGRSRVIPI